MAKGDRITWLRVQTKGGVLGMEVIHRETVRLRIVVEKDAQYHVIAPNSLTDAEIADFVLENEDWLREKVEERKAKRAAPGTIMLKGKILDLRFVASQQEFVKVTNEALIVSGPLTRGPGILDRWWRDRLRDTCKPLMEKWFPVIAAHGRKKDLPDIVIRKMRKSWGTCTPGKNVIRYNYYLLCAPEEGIEYVVFHELTHLLYIDHGPLFKQFLQKFMPDWKQRVKDMHGAAEYLGEF